MGKSFGIVLIGIVFSLNILAAEFSGGNGSIESPYHITTIQELNNVRNYLTSYFIQQNDLDFSESSYNEGWEPIGTEAEPFKGHFNGQGYGINSLYISRSEAGTGLFGYTHNAVLENIHLEDCNIVGGDLTGGLVGYSRHGKIQSSRVIGNVNGDESTGGITGYSDTTYYAGAHYVGELTGSSQVGGIVGTGKKVTIKACSSNCSITNSVVTIGGLIGHCFNSIIDQSYVKSEITCYDIIGGIAGVCLSSKITNSYSISELKGGALSGGLVGSIGLSEITNCYVAGPVLFDGESNPLDVGSIIGRLNSTTIKNTYYNKVLTDISDNGFGEGLSFEEMRTIQKFNGWDFVGETENGTNDLWAIKSGYNKGFPYLSWEIPVAEAGIFVNTLEPTYVRYASAKLHGEIEIADTVQIINHGFCYNSGTSADFGNYVVELGKKENAGEFSAIVVNIGKDEKFAFRAFAITESDTVVGDLKIFVPEEVYDYVSDNDISFTISSNPVEDHFYLKGLEGSANIYLYSIGGNVVKTKTTIDHEIIDVSNLSKGIYLLKVEYNNKIQQIKLLKE